MVVKNAYVLTQCTALIVLRGMGHSRFGHDELLEMDAEGRCVITDHGEFVLFNVYAPAIANAERAEERFAFKLKLFEVSC